MRIDRAVLLGVLSLLLLTGCGGDRDIDISIHIGEQETEAAAAQSTSSPESAATTAEPDVMPPMPTAASAEPTAAAAEPAQTPEPTASAEQVDAPTEAPATQVPPEATSAPTEPPSPTQAPPPTDMYTFDPEDWQQSMATLSSFRQKVVLDFTADGTGVHSKATYEGEVTTNPAALHSLVGVEGEAASQLPANQVEVIWIGDTAWVKVGRRPWVQVPVAALESEYAGQVVGVGDLLPYVAQARRVLPDETVNGILCEHYVYDISNLQTEAGMTTAQGDIWAAEDGGYVVRLTMNGHGTYYATYTTSGTLNLVYDLFDVNVPISINPPR
jgi:hypothetical protein